MITLKKLSRAMSEIDCPLSHEEMAEIWFFRRDEEGIKRGSKEWRENALADMLLEVIGDDNAGDYCYYKARESNIEHIFKDALEEVEEFNREWEEQN
jgi:hypothetical protein